MDAYIHEHHKGLYIHMHTLRMISGARGVNSVNIFVELYNSKYLIKLVIL